MSKLRKHDYTLDGSDWDLSLLGLNEAPVDELQRNPKSRKIDLSNNALVKLPPSFTSLTHLIELDLSKNSLTELPQSFGDLYQLKRLDLYQNKLKTLPITFGQLTKLKWLDLKSNPLEPTLAKQAGDCANQKQCQTCASNCVKFMKSEKLRIESEMRLKEEKLRQKQVFEKQLEEKNKKEKQKKKEKNARRSARKAQQVVEDNRDNGDNDSDDSDSITKAKISDKSGNNSLVSSFLWLIRFLISVSFVLFILFIAISIGLRLQSGHKLESLADIRTALSNSFKSIQNSKELESITKETAILFENIVKSLKNWRKLFDVFDNKQNSSKT